MLIKKIMTCVFVIVSLATTPLVQATEHKHVTPFNDVSWQNTGLEGVEMSVLWGNETDGSAIYAFRIQPGVAIPAHRHSNDYWGIAVQGKWEHTDAKGHTVITDETSFAYIKANDLHADRCVGPEVCINVLDFNGTRDFILPE